MYRTKRAGRRGFSSYDDSIGDEARRVFEIEELLKSSDRDKRFHLVFQPIVRLSDQQAIGAEGLLRMTDGVGRLVSPADFIPLAEECGMMPELGNFVLRRGAAEFAAAMRHAKRDTGRLSLNLSPVQVSEELPEIVAHALHLADFPGERLILEITEGVFLKQDKALLTIFERLRGLGCRLALDDFGTGYSSLSYLNDIPIDVVKIDREFVRRLDGDGGKILDAESRRRATSLLEGVSAIARGLRFETVAEGVETEAQYRIVRDIGFDFGQGFLWSRPVAADVAARRLSGGPLMRSGS